MRISDWSSDVGSSDLNYCSEVFRYAIPDGRCDSDPCHDLSPAMAKKKPVRHRSKIAAKDLPDFYVKFNADTGERRSEERRVGKRVSVRVDLGGCRIIKKKKTEKKYQNITTKKS